MIFVQKLTQVIVFFEFLLRIEASSCKLRNQNEPDPNANSSLDYNVISHQHLKGARWNMEQEDKKPVDVYFAIELLDLSKIDPTNGEFRVDFNLKQRWVAPQIKFPDDLFHPKEPSNTSVTVDGDVLADLWTPDAFIPNSRDAQIEELTYCQQSVTIFKNNTIILSTNMYTINGCAMEFQCLDVYLPINIQIVKFRNLRARRYPMETQRCTFILESYSYTNKNVLFHWDNATVPDPIYLPRLFNMRQYTLTVPLLAGNGSVHRFGRGDSYSRIYIVFILKRQLGHFIIQTFMPTCFIVFLSWFSFWLGMDAIPARVALLVTCMLTLVTLYSGQKVDLPPVSYVKMMDVWMTSCLAFVFAAMFEFVIVRYLANQEFNYKQSKAKFEFLPTYWQDFYQKKRTMNDEFRILEARLARGGGPIPAWNPVTHDEYSGNGVSRRGNNFADKSKFGGTAGEESIKFENRRKKLWKRIDFVARVAFPLLFLCFCIIFWPILIFGDPKPSSWGESWV